MAQTEVNLSFNALKESDSIKEWIQHPLSYPLQYQKKTYAATQYDIQYQIFSTFFKKSGADMIQKELAAIQASQKLVLALHQKISRNVSKQQSVELSQTKDGTLYNQEESMFDLEQQSHQPLKRILSRTRLNKNTTRKVISYQSIALKEVEQKCSQKTFNFIRNLIEQNRKISQGQGDHQKKDSNLKRAKERLQQIQQQNLILKSRSKQNQITVKRLQQQLNSLKKFKKESSLSRVCSASSLFNIEKNSKLHGFKALQLNQNGIRVSENFLQQKQLLLKQKQQRLRQVDDKIIDLLCGEHKKMQKCQKCCIMLKKLKEAILKYKSYMEIQLDSTEKLYQKFKVAFVA